MNTTNTRYGFAIAAVMSLAFSGWANAEEICNLGAETGAYSVQADSGQGNYDCSVQSTTTGPLVDVTNLATITQDKANGYINWAYSDQTGQQLRVYSASVYTGGKGSRCNYQYPVKKDEGFGLGDGTPTSKDIEVVICAAPDNNLDLPFAATVIDTETDLCDAKFDYVTGSGTEVTGRQFPTAFGLASPQVGTDAELALCSKSSQATIDKGLGQKRCSGRCEPREIPAGTDCTANADGSLPLACAPCEWDSDLVNTSTGQSYKACWYWQNRVCSSADAAAGLYADYPDHYCYADEDGIPGPDRIMDTFIPKSKKNSYTIEVHEMDGSTCYLYSYGRWWAYSCP